MTTGRRRSLGSGRRRISRMVGKVRAPPCGTSSSGKKRIPVWPLSFSHKGILGEEHLADSCAISIRPHGRQICDKCIVMKRIADYEGKLYAVLLDLLTCTRSFRSLINQVKPPSGNPPSSFDSFPTISTRTTVPLLVPHS
jgi:hypothetical protein